MSRDVDLLASAWLGLGPPFIWESRVGEHPLDEIEQLKARLWKYGKHLDKCRLNKDLTSWCDCGWKEIRETLTPAPMGKRKP